MEKGLDMEARIAPSIRKLCLVPGHLYLLLEIATHPIAG